MSLKTRVLLLVLILLIAGIWTFALRISSVLQVDLGKMVADQLSATVGYVAIDMDSNLNLRVTMLNEIAALITPEMLDDPRRLQTRLEQQRPSPSVFPRGLFVHNKDGVIVGNYVQVREQATDDIGEDNFRAVVTDRKPYYIAPFVSRRTGQPVISITVPLRDAAGTPVGALTASVSPLDIDLFNFRDSPMIGKVVRIVVISPEARQVISASDADRIFKPLPPKGENPLLDRRLEQGFEGAGITKTSYGAETLSVNRNLRMTDWTIIGGVSTDHAFGPIKTLQRQIYLTAIVITIAVAILLREILIRQLAPLKDAADAMRLMAEEKGPSLRELPVKQDDEIGFLIGNFNRLVLERSRLYEELQETTRTLQKAQSVASVGSWKLDLRHRRLSWSEETCKIFGVPVGTSLTPKTFLRCILPEDRLAVVKAWKSALKSGSVDIEHRVNVSEGVVKWARQKLEVMFDAAGKPSVVIGTVQDITQNKLSDARIEFLAFHDTLTQLPNRALAKDHMELAMAYADRLNDKAAVLFIDLDKFKAINDSLGHQAGDELLKGVANRLRECVRDMDTICRQGGDEFLILLNAVPDTDAISTVADKILEKMKVPFNLDGHQIYSGMSIGVAVYPDDGNDFEVLVKAADTAMYHAKEGGRNTYRFYTEHMNVETTSHLKSRNDLRQALEQGEFVLHYQPQVDMNNAETIGAEALIRWNHPEHGLISAKDIIPAAEESGLIIPIGQWVLTQACKQAVAWHEAGSPNLVVTVNLSSAQFKRGDLENSVELALSESGLDPKYLELELTESVLIEDSGHALTVLQRLKALGIKLSIDDFGTGYTNLPYLKRFAVDKLKIDQSLIRDLASNKEDEAIVRAIIQMAHSLNVKTIAEGVEQEQSVKILHELHCDEAQGAYFGMPMPTEKVVNYF